MKSGIAPANFAMTDWESFDVRFGSKADMKPLDWDVRFTPESGRSTERRGCPLRVPTGRS